MEQQEKVTELFSLYATELSTIAASQTAADKFRKIKNALIYGINRSYTAVGQNLITNAVSNYNIGNTEGLEGNLTMFTDLLTNVLSIGIMIGANAQKENPMFSETFTLNNTSETMQPNNTKETIH